MTVGKTDRRSRGEMARVLVVDDEADIRELLDLTLARMGLSADCAGTVAEAKKFLERERYSLCLTDMRLPDGEGLDIVRLIGALYGETPVAVITAFGSADNAVAALKAGAFDYLAKPVALEQLRSLIKSALNLPQIANAPGGSEVVVETTGQLTGQSPAIVYAREMIAKLARSQAPVYVSGESGSGKELAARLIHSQSARHTAPFVPVNCGAIPENLMESEFFGYRKGAFTGAVSESRGRFERADGGTIFLDEIGELPPNAQVRLLRVLQNREVERVGGKRPIPVDIRVIAATHRNLQSMVVEGSFREDLWYRLSGFPIMVPPVRQRKEDVPALTRHFVTVRSRDLGIGVPPSIAPGALQRLMEYDWPGNVRELENLVERELILHRGGPLTFSTILLGPEQKNLPLDAGNNRSIYPLNLDEANAVHITEVLRLARGKIDGPGGAAEMLGINPSTLRSRSDKLGISYRLRGRENKR